MGIRREMGRLLHMFLGETIHVGADGGVEVVRTGQDRT